MFRRKVDPSQSVPVDWMVVGLGNPGPEYKSTRHNIGFDAVERFAESQGLALKSGRSKSLTGRGLVGSVCVLLVKPLTYMNLSGQAVAPLARSEGVPPERIVVISDDLDLPLGRIRLRDSGGAGGHNGHKSIQSSLGTQSYPRLRIGIGRSDDETVDHVLSKFHPDERGTAVDACKVAAEILAEVVQGNWNQALELQDRWNKGLSPQ